MQYLNQLNDVQREAVIAKDGPSLVVAGAGSGKTRVLTYRIAHLLATGTAPWNILALTFTNKAAREMKERIAAVVGEHKAAALAMGTFHSIFSKILRVEHEQIGFPPSFTIYDTADSKNLIKSILKELRLDDKEYPAGTVLGRISMAKNNLVTAAAYKGNAQLIENDQANKRPEIARIYEIYSKRCIQSGAMDFDDLLLYTNILFRDHPAILAKYQERFHYVLVDEYQDTNYSQYLIIKKLCQQHNNICVVGDDAQSIYSFRGAKIENILNFKNDYPQHHLFKLEQNYRSTQTIVDAANSLIKKNQNQIPKEVYSENEVGNPIKVIEAFTDVEEGYQVVSDIFDNLNNKQLTYNDFAILYRTNAQSRIFEEALRKRNIPYKIYGGLSFYQRKEVKDLIAYFRMVVNPNDSEALKRIINFPARGIGDTTLEKIEQAASAMGVSMWTIIKHPGHNPANLNKGTLAKIEGFVRLIESFSAENEKNDAYDLARLIANQSGLIKELHMGDTPEERSRYENVEELLTGISDYVTANSNSGETPRLAGFLENVALLTDQDTEKPEERNRITMMTIHSAKGLEFPFVYIVGMEEKLFPSEMSAYSPHELEEERRLFYVALTRARVQVTLSYCKNRFRYGSTIQPPPSRFIKDIDKQYLTRSIVSGSGFSSSGSFGIRQPSGIAQTNNPMNRKVPMGMNFAASRKLQQMKSNPSSDFIASPPNQIKSGMMVEHAQFGQGKILQIEGEGNNRKALVFFTSAGEKKLLLQFAKLRIIEN